MNTLNIRNEQAEAALTMLKGGIANNSKDKILAAYEIVEDDKEFSWSGLNHIADEWDELVDKANEILYDGLNHVPFDR